ncbi:hypothetical protein WIS52_20545 [Pseudonocardia nematodicida]|uniref:Uncharacterized protein n=1 Tax=Pseudonocardia nematodicida TaxID=1206997 RepID=A0ABV1KEU4_9PSEU
MEPARAANAVPPAPSEEPPQRAERRARLSPLQPRPLRDRVAAANAVAEPVAPAEQPSIPDPALVEQQPEHELAAPQLPLDTALPRADVRTEPQLQTAHLPRATVARYAPAQESFTRSVRSLEPITDLEAASFAGRFAADFQSFDEDNLTRRAEVLRTLLADPQACTWGWSGAARQRADSPLPGRLHRVSDTVVFVEVVVRATTYARACPPPDEPTRHAAGEQRDPVGLLGPSCAPSDADPGWTAVAANWVRMTVPITRHLDDGRLVVDPHLVPDQSS